MMLQYRVKVVGLHYAANPTYVKEMGKVPEMEENTVQVLKALDESRPQIVLMPEPDNPCDPHAVMARAHGKRIGYVSKSDLETVHRLLELEKKPFLVGNIDEVEVWKRGNLQIHLDSHEKLTRLAEPWGVYDWSEWKYDLSLLPVKDTWYACQEAEYMIEEYYFPFMDENLLDECERYLDVWLENSVYDISNETFKFCNRYIKCFGEHENPRVQEWAERLKKHCTAFYGSKRTVNRMEWWNTLQQSVEMRMLWEKWQYHTSYNCRRGLYEVDSHLRRLPNNLYSLIGDLDRLLASIYYHNVPRNTLWSIYSALLIRIRTCQSLGIEMKPLPVDSVEYGDAVECAASSSPVLAAPALPEALCTPQAKALLTKLHEVGMLNKQGQPVGLSNSEKGILADFMAVQLDIPHHWKLFANLWKMNCETLRVAFHKGMEQKKTLSFQEALKEISRQV